MGKDMEKVLQNLQMDLIIEEILQRDKLMEKEYLNGLMGVNLKEHGRITNILKE